MRMRMFSALGAIAVLALGGGFADAASLAPGGVADMQASGGSPVRQATLRADGAPAAFTGELSVTTSTDQSASGEATTSDEDAKTETDTDEDAKTEADTDEDADTDSDEDTDKDADTDKDGGHSSDQANTHTHD